MLLPSNKSENANFRIIGKGPQPCNGFSLPDADANVLPATIVLPEKFHRRLLIIASGFDRDVGQSRAALFKGMIGVLRLNVA
ncbi:MAG: hypothetical protein H6978_07855 [Gammaproteobacteria bacterium]|nr:hypothetical protein [Gammaproteobacteria bacterium]